MDAITLLEQDHREVEKLFKRFERAGDRANKEKREIVDQIITELARHAMVEEQFLYPAIRERVKDREDLALEALEEHHVVKWMLYELNKIDPDHERFDAKMSVLMENVRHHVEEEEGEMWKVLRRAFDQQELEDLGVLMQEAKKIAPTRPHPRAPDQPPGNFIAGAVSGIMDRGLDLVTGQKKLTRQVSARLGRRLGGKNARGNKR